MVMVMNLLDLSARPFGRSPSSWLGLTCLKCTKIFKCWKQGFSSNRYSHFKWTPSLGPCIALPWHLLVDMYTRGAWQMMRQIFPVYKYIRRALWWGVFQFVEWLVATMAAADAVMRWFNCIGDKTPCTGFKLVKQIVYLTSVVVLVSLLLIQVYRQSPHPWATLTDGGPPFFPAAWPPQLCHQGSDSLRSSVEVQPTKRQISCNLPFFGRSLHSQLEALYFTAETDDTRFSQPPQPCPLIIEENLKLYTAAQHCAWKCIHCCVAVYNLKIICIALLEHWWSWIFGTDTDTDTLGASEPIPVLIPE